jgi:hypothetical protein
MAQAELPAWLKHLDEADLQFIRRMVLASGSLKQLAEDYRVSYPTIRARLDRIIERIKLLERHESDDALERRVRMLVADGQLEARLGSELMRLHRGTKEKTK